MSSVPVRFNYTDVSAFLSYFVFFAFHLWRFQSSIQEDSAEVIIFQRRRKGESRVWFTGKKTNLGVRNSSPSSAFAPFLKLLYRNRLLVSPLAHREEKSNPASHRWALIVPPVSFSPSESERGGRQTHLGWIQGLERHLLVLAAACAGLTACRRFHCKTCLFFFSCITY